MDYSNLTKEVAAFFASSKNGSPNAAIPKEYIALAKSLEQQVGGFIAKNNFSAAAYTQGAAMEAMQDLDASVSRCGVENIVNFLRNDVKVPEIHMQNATLSFLNVLSRHSNANGKAGLWSSQLLRASQDQSVKYASLEAIYSDDVLQTMSSDAPSMEAFGADMNVTPADLKTALVLTLLQYYVGLITRVLPTIPINQPSVLFKKSRRKVMDLAVSQDRKYNFIELMRDPDLLWGELVKIVPLGANASSGEILLDGSSHPIDGVLVPGIKLNILKLAVDETKYGHAKINMTDTVSDNVYVDYVYITISNGTATEVFKCKVATTYARLTRTNNSKDAADRQAIFQTKFLLRKGVTNAAGSTTALLSAVSDGEGLLVTVDGTAKINIKTGEAFAQFTTAVEAYPVQGTSASAALTAALELIDEATVKPNVVGYVFDARYGEDNFRKASKLATIDQQQLSYEIMQGTNYFVQVSMQDKQQEDATIDLGQLITLEVDASQERVIEGTINKVNTALTMSGTLNPVDDIGAEFIAGDIVFPATYNTTLDVAKLKVLQTGDVTGDVRTRVRTFLGYVTTELVRLSQLDKVLTSGAEINYGLITNRRVLDNCLSVKHYHNHLNVGDTPGNNNGIEFRLVLDNGIILNIVTTTFKSFYGTAYQDGTAANKNVDKMVLFPIMPASPDSYLNFGQVYDYGAMSGRYAFTDRNSSVERIFANVRRQLIPTNPQGAIIDVVGIDSIMADAVYAKALTSSSTGTINF